MKTGIELIAEERQEQIEKHGFTIEQDKKFYCNNELIQGALFCISPMYFAWPENWARYFKGKISKKGRVD